MNNRQTIKLNAQLVKEARINIGHTQESLQAALKVSGTAISRKTISSIENGNKTEYFFATKIAKELHVTLDHLMGREEPKLHYWVQIYDQYKSGEFISINNLGTIFENHLDLLNFIDDQVFSKAPQYATELPKILSSYYLDSATNTILISVCYDESDHSEQFKIELKLIKLADEGLKWTKFSEFKYHWVEKTLKEFLYKRSTYVNPHISTQLIEQKYQIHIEQLPSKNEELEVIKSLSNYDSIDEQTSVKKSKAAWNQLALSFIKYDPIETKIFNHLSRAIQLILNEYNPSKSTMVQCNFESNNNVQFDLFPNMQSDKIRGLRLNIYRVESDKNSIINAPWPEYQMRVIESIWNIYADAPDNQLVSHVLTTETINEIKHCL